MASIITKVINLSLPEELMEYMWLRPTETNLNVDIFVDDGGSYLRHEHELLLLVRNGYDQSVNEFVPFSISLNPQLLSNIQIHISNEDVLCVQQFITSNLQLLQTLADRQISQQSFVETMQVWQEN